MKYYSSLKLALQDVSDNFRHVEVQLEAPKLISITITSVGQSFTAIGFQTFHTAFEFGIPESVTPTSKFPIYHATNVKSLVEFSYRSAKAVQILQRTIANTLG